MNNFNKINNMNIVRSQFIEAFNAEINEFRKEGENVTILMPEKNRLFHQWQREGESIHFFVQKYMQR